MANPLVLNSAGHQQEADPASLSFTLSDTTALAAYAGAVTQVVLANGRSYLYSAASTLTPVGKFIINATGKGSGRWLLIASCCNVIDFGADNTASVDSASAINAAISYARTLSGVNGGAFRFYIEVPTGFYLLNSTLNLTNMNGVWLLGMGGSYINTGFIGCTSASDGSGLGIMADFTGSSLCGARNISFTADSSWGNIASKVAVLYALGTDTAGGTGNQTGGLNCRLESCFIGMYDSTTVNNGFGTIGLINCRAEEFNLFSCVIQANLPMIFTNQADFTVDGISYNINSQYGNVARTANGSMGVTTAMGNHLKTLQKRQSAMLLINTDSFQFHGYIGRYIATAGTQETAIRLLGQNVSLNLSGTIESYSRVGKLGSSCQRPRFNFVQANQTAPTTEVYDITGTELVGPEFGHVFNIPSEFNNGRIFLYHAPVNINDSPATGSIINGTFECGKWVNNSNFISPNLLKNSQNSRFNTGQPFEKRNLAVVDCKDYAVPLGTTQSNNADITGSVIHFTKPTKGTTTSGNGGVYQARIVGLVTIGGYASTAICSIDFESKVLLTQNANGSLNTADASTMIMNKSQNNASVIDITSIDVSIDVSGTFGAINLTIKSTGTGSGLAAVFQGRVELISDFAVEQAIILN